MNVELNPTEQGLLAQIEFEPSRGPDSLERLQVSCAAAKSLAHSLLDRSAIPEVRLRYFTDPALNIGSRMSRKQVFESNGTRGDSILGHGNFLPHLRYFVFGPELPSAAIDEFCSFVSERQPITSGDLSELCDEARRLTRRFSLAPRDAHEEFFKLALECELDDTFARAIRDAVRTIR